VGTFVRELYQEVLSSVNKIKKFGNPEFNAKIKQQEERLTK